MTTLTGVRSDGVMSDAVGVSSPRQGDDQRGHNNNDEETTSKYERKPHFARPNQTHMRSSTSSQANGVAIEFKPPASSSRSSIRRWFASSGL